MNKFKDIAEVYAESSMKFIIMGYEKCEVCNRDYPIIADRNQVNEGNVDDAIKTEECFHCLRDKEDNEFRKEAIKQMKRRELRKYDKYSIIPYDLQDASLDSYIPENETQKQALEDVKKYIEGNSDKKTLFLQGDTGLGKSHLSLSAYKEISQNEPAIYIDVPELMNMIRSTYNGGRTTQDEIMTALQEVELLVLDDIGAEYVKPDANGFESWAADILFQISNARQGKRNIYTTNFPSKYLSKKYGMMSKRIISRLMNNAKIIKFEGKDYRLKGLE